jgi:Concanavalin A-like lectin/glucanases superfamily
VTGNQFILNKAADNFQSGYGITMQGSLWKFYQPGTSEEMSLNASTGWKHHTIVRNGSSLTWYVHNTDGTLATQTSGTASGATSDTTSPLQIGGCNHGDFQWYLNGAMDDVRLYSSALTVSEIASMLTGAAPPVSKRPNPPGGLRLTPQ